MNNRHNSLKVVRIPSRDWEGLYVNGELMIEAHKIDLLHFNMYCPIDKIETFYLKDFDKEKDCFPKTFYAVAVLYQY